MHQDSHEFFPRNSLIIRGIESSKYPFLEETRHVGNSCAQETLPKRASIQPASLNRPILGPAARFGEMGKQLIARCELLIECRLVGVTLLIVVNFFAPFLSVFPRVCL